MKEEVVLLSNYLRNEGMLVSIRSTLLAFHVLENIGYSMTYEDLFNALRVIYVKNIEDYDKFERAFKKVFDDVEFNQKTFESDSNDDNLLNNSEGENIQNNFPHQNLEELQELYDKMIEDKANTKAKEGRILNGSMILLDSYDPKVFELCRRLSRKIANKRSNRRKKSNSRHIDMSRTIRANIKNGGHFVKLIYDKPPMRKTKHIFLCDVSGSCEWITSWFFLLLYGCKKTFNKVKIYDFDNKLTDVTDILGTESFNNIGQVNVAQRSKGISCYGQSDMTKAFEEFLDVAEITNRTDIIILTDCRDWKGERINGVLKSATLVKTMINKAHRVIILNPEKKIRWNNATSCVKDYEDVGAKVFETSSLEKFEKVISEL